MNETGDLALAEPQAIAGKVLALADLLHRGAPERPPRSIAVYKSVGIGMQDIALAGHTWKLSAG